MSARLRIASILLVAHASLFPAVAAAPSRGTEIAVAAPAGGPAGRAMIYSSWNLLSIASNGDMALAVWQERRSANESDLFATRVDKNGEPLDPYSIPLTATSLFEEKPHVVWDGAKFIVAWNAVDTFNPTNRTVMIASLAPDGRLAAPAVSVARGFLDDLAFSNGVAAVAVHAGDSNVNDVVAAYLVGGSSVAQATLGVGTNVHLTATSSGFAASWQFLRASTEEIHAARFSPSGMMTRADTIVASLPASAFGQQDISARGDDAYIAAGGSSLTVYRMPPDGGAVESLATTPFGAQGGFVWDLTPVADGFIANVSTIPNGPQVWRLNSGGAFVDALASPAPAGSTFVTSMLAGRPYVISNDSAPAPREMNVYGRFADDGTPHLLSRAAPSQQSPVIASDGEHLLIVWAEEHGYRSYATKGVIAALDGRPLTAPFDLFPDRPNGNAAAAIFDGHDFLVVREETREITEEEYQDLVATHVSRDGVPRGDRITITQAANVNASPALATDGTSVLIAWIHGYYAAPRARVALLSPTTLYDAPVDLGAANSISAAWNGTSYAVTTASNDLHVTRVTREGSISSSATLPPVQLFGASIASDADGFLVAYSRVGAIAAMRLDHDAQPVGSEIVVRPLTEPGTTFTPPRIAWSGSAYTMAWSERPTFSYFSDVYAAMLTRDGNAFAPRIALSTGDFDDASPFPFGVGGSTSIVGYSRMTPELGQSQRVFTRLLSMPRVRAVR